MSRLADWAVKHTNVSTPQLEHTPSRRSVAATEDYCSVSDNPSSDNDEQRRLTSSRRFSTPPSRVRSREEYHDILDSEATALPIRPANQQAHEVTIPPVARFSVRRKPIPTPVDPTKRARQMDAFGGPPTPGVDDTPYIRFALDQLTADEEVRGASRLYNTGASEAQYPVALRVPNKTPSYDPQEPPPTPPRHPEHTYSGQHSPLQPDIFIPVDPPKGSSQYSALNFLPSVLRPPVLAILILLCLLMITGLLFCAIYSSANDGLWAYTRFGGGRYFVFQYLPTMLGMILLFWVFQVETAVHRIAPFAAIASNSAHPRSQGFLMDLYPTNFIVPKISYFRAGQPLLGACLSILWLQVFTIPLLGTLFNVRYYGTPANGSWIWVTTQGVAWTLFALYVLLVLALLLLGLSFWRKPTGLQWDPRSLADIVALLERSNIMDDYFQSEIFSHASNFRERLSMKSHRLGYWRTSRRPNDIFYGIGEEGAPTRRYTIAQGKITEKSPDRLYSREDDDLEEQQRMPTPTQQYLQREIHSPTLRYRYVPWFLKDTFVVAWVVIAIILLLAFLIISFVNDAVLRGFLPMVAAPTDTAGFSPTNFLYSFIPGLLGTLLFLFWLSIDLAFRRLQPYADIAQPNGALAEHSLLLEYPACFPVVITIRAAIARHFKVAYFSFLTLLAATLPVLAGGVFWAQFYVPVQEVRIAAHPPAYYALCVFLSIFAFSFLLIWPGRKRYLPHSTTTLAEIISFVYQSPLLGDAAFRAPSSKTDLVTRLMTSPRGERGVMPRYAFGVFQGRDGREHLGIDRLQRPGSGDMLVLSGKLQRSPK